MHNYCVAVHHGVGPNIMVSSGSWFDLLDPWSSNFTIEDIARGLSNICRYSGQCSKFYSVAEHSLLVSDVVSSFKFEGLLHDAAEAFLGDITRPLKQLLPQYKEIERNVEDAINQRFYLDVSSKPLIKAADLSVLAAEQAQVMPEGTDAWAKDARVLPAPVVVRFLPPEQAQLAFLERFYSLRQARPSVAGSVSHTTRCDHSGARSASGISPYAAQRATG